MTCIKLSVSDACVSWYHQTVTRYRIRSRSDTCRCPHYMVVFCHSRCCSDSRTWRYFLERNRVTVCHREDHLWLPRMRCTSRDGVRTGRLGLSSQYLLAISEAWRSEWNLWRYVGSFDQSSTRVSMYSKILSSRKWGQRTRGEDLVRGASDWTCARGS